MSKTNSSTLPMWFFFFLRYIHNHLPHDMDACPVLRLAIAMHTYLVQQFAPEYLQTMKTQSDRCLSL